MPRVARQQSESGFYHVILRGNGRQAIFESDRDRVDFLETLRKRSDDFGVSVIAWCLMDNHVHLLVEDPAGVLSEMAQRLAGEYAQRFNRRSGHVGHVFESRFKSLAIEDEAYLLQAVRYIHNNPVKGGICDADEYPWSSYGEYLGRGRAYDGTIADTGLVLGLCGGVAGFRAYSGESGGGTYRFDGGHRVSDGEMGEVAREYLGDVPPHEVGALPRPKRNELLRGLRQSGLSVRQIERLTGIGHGTITRVTKP